MNLSLINIFSFQAGWFACVLGAAHGKPLLGPAVVAVLLGLHLYLAADVKREIHLLVVATAIGFVIDSLQAKLGIFSFGKSSASSWVSPLWMTALWPNFATTLHTSLGWMAEHYALAAILGAIAGPLSYYAGAHLGALSLHPNLLVSLGVLSVVWGIIMPVLLWLAGPSPGASRISGSPDAATRS
jgi:Protein of unknown function (DUF2878)